MALVAKPAGIHTARLSPIHTLNVAPIAKQTVAPAMAAMNLAWLMLMILLQFKMLVVEFLDDKDQRFHGADVEIMAHGFVDVGGLVVLAVVLHPKVSVSDISGVVQISELFFNVVWRSGDRHRIPAIGFRDWVCGLVRVSLADASRGNQIRVVAGAA
jgi:hypothetical protein